MKLNFKKIASVLSSAVMLSSTIGLAAAANYPSPFVKSGSADVAVIWGSNAAASDLVAVTDITSDLQAALAAQTASVSSSGSTVSANGDYIVLETPSSKLHLGSTVGNVFTRSITSSDIPSILADGTFTDNVNTDHDYTQKIDVNQSMKLQQFDDSNYAEDQPTLGFDVASGNGILTYTLDFTKSVDTGVMATSDLNMMGQDYYVLAADNSSITLLDSANTAIATEGQTQKVTVNNTEYDVAISSVGSDYVVFNVNGETTNKLAEGATYKLKGTNTYVGVKSILYNSKDTGISNVQFSIGNGKLVLTDGSNVEMNDNTINGLAATLDVSGTGDLNDIVLQWTADDTTFIAPNSSPVMPGFENLKLSFAGMTYPANETITVSNDGDNAFRIDAPLKDGDTTLDLVYDNSTGSFLGLGKDSSHLLETTNKTTFAYDQTNSGNSFVASFNDGKNAESYVLYTTGFTTNNEVNYTTFQKRNDGGSFTQQVKNGDSITLGSVVLNIGQIDRNARTVKVTASSSNTNFHTMYTKSGLQIWLPWVGNVTGSGQISVSSLNQGGVTSFPLVFSEADKDGNVGAGENITMTLGTEGTDFKTSVTGVTNSTGSFSSQDEIDSSNVYDMHAYSQLASEVQLDKGPDQQTATLTYHGGESYGQLVLTSADVTVSSDNTVSTGGVVKKLGSVAVSDAEVASVANNNLVVVGGSCVNSVAAQLLGGALCGADFEAKTGAGAGSFVIETFSQSSGKVATLVAGYNAADTTNAAQYFITQPVDTTPGKTYLGTSSTSATLKTTNSTA
jgi:hypothetical protein